MKQLEPINGVLFHDFKFILIQTTWFEQNLIGYADLANVMHGRGFQQQLLVGHRQTKSHCNQTGVVRHTQDVCTGFGIAVLGCFAQAKHRFTLTRNDLRRGLAHFAVQPFGTISKLLARVTHNQHIAGARQKLHLVDRLGQKVVGAQVKRPVSQLLLVIGGDHDDGHPVAPGYLAHEADELQTVQLGHHVVNNHQVGNVVMRPGQRFTGIGKRVGHAVVKLFDQRAKQNQVDLGVIDDQHLVGHVVQPLLNCMVSLLCAIFNNGSDEAVQCARQGSNHGTDSVEILSQCALLHLSSKCTRGCCTKHGQGPLQGVCGVHDHGQIAARQPITDFPKLGRPLIDKCLRNDLDHFLVSAPQRGQVVKSRCLWRDCDQRSWPRLRHKNR